MSSDISVLNSEERLILALRAIYEGYGYKKYRMSRFEEYRLYMENKNFLVSESVISFTDLDGRLLALKPDVTLSIVRQSKPEEEQRVYYIENVYRPDKAYRNYREIEQMGLERIGKIDTFAIIETASLASRTLYEVSKESLLEIGHMGFITGLFKALQIPNELDSKLFKLISEKNIHTINSVCKSYGLSDAAINMLMILPTLCGSFEDVIANASKLCISPDMTAALNQLASLAVLENKENLSKVRLDLSLIGEEDYYNGVIFAGYINGLPSAVLSGGQYDKVMQKFSKSNGAVGFALYLNELELLFNENKDCDFDIKLIYDDSISPDLLYNEVQTLRNSGKSVYVCAKGENAAVKTDKELFINAKGEIE